MTERDPTPGDHGLITAAELGRLWQVSEDRARSIMSANKIKRISGYPRDLALRSSVRPGRGTRTDLAKDKKMTATTTEYGTWADHGTGGGTATLEDTVVDAVGEFADRYDIDGLAAAYRDAINAALPEGVALRGSDFYGPYPAPADAGEVCSEAVGSVDLFALADAYDLTGENQH